MTSGPNAQGILHGLRVVEAASFIAGPSCGLHLAQMGAEVIRIDPPGGGPDRFRWPKTVAGESLYWEGLNKGKKSVVVDLAKPEGRGLAQRLATAPGANAGLFVTNFPIDGFLGHSALRALRPDLISLHIMGWKDGTTAVDYTVNAAAGIPLMTGPADLPVGQPVNSVLPTWDLLAGAYGAFSLLAAERARRESGQGREIRLPLGDLASATVGALGQLAETLASGDRPRTGNDLYGAFGRDFVTADGHRLMVVAITARQWSDLVAVLGLQQDIAAIEADQGVSFKRDEGLRYSHRERLWPLFEAAFARLGMSELVGIFDRTGVCWAPYRTVREAVSATDRFGLATGMATVAHPSGSYPTPGSPASLSGPGTMAPGPAPRLGQHTDEVLTDILGLSQSEIAEMHDRKLVG